MASLVFANSIYRNDYKSAKRYNGLAAKLYPFVKGAETDFSYMELGYANETAIPIDTLFEKQLEQFIKENSQEVTLPKLFRGQSHDSFDCELKEVDFRGKISRGILILTGTTIEIPCTFPKFTTGEIKERGDTRIWAIGNAIYDGVSQLPIRIEVSSMRPIGKAKNPTDWKGAIKPFELSDWDFDDDHISKQ